MKKLDRKKMEARLQTMMNEPEDISEERMEAIKQRAHDEYLRRMEAQAAQKVQHRKSLHHGVGLSRILCKRSPRV